MTNLASRSPLLFSHFPSFPCLHYHCKYSRRSPKLCRPFPNSCSKPSGASKRVSENFWLCFPACLDIHFSGSCASPPKQHVCVTNIQSWSSEWQNFKLVLLSTVCSTVTIITLSQTQSGVRVPLAPFGFMSAFPPTFQSVFDPKIKQDYRMFTAF